MINFKTIDVEFFGIEIDGLPLRTYPKIYQAKITSADRVILYNTKTEKEVYNSLRFNEFSVNGVVSANANAAQVLLNALTFNDGAIVDFQPQIDSLQSQIDNSIPYIGATQNIDLADKNILFSASGYSITQKCIESPAGDKYYFPNGTSSALATEEGLNNLQSSITAINAIIGSSTPDANNIIDTVAELLQVFANFPEVANMASILNSKKDKTTSVILSLIAGTTATTQKIQISDNGIINELFVDALFSAPPLKNALGKIILPIIPAKTNVICRGKTAQALASNTWNLLRTWVKISDLGNNFNPLTGVFTCVNAGIYSFSTGNASNIPASQYYGMAIRKNGTQLYNDLRYSGIAGIYYCSLAGTIELAVGDTLVSTFFKGGPGGVLDTVSAGNSWFTINQL